MPMLAPGQSLAGYEVLAFVGKGGMGEIYRARQTSIGREVALKILAPKLAADPRFAAQFVAEARAAGRLNHPTIIAVHDVGQGELEGTTVHYFSMEFVDGENLKQILERNTAPLPLDLVGRVMIAMADALAYAARAGMIHRDIKPDNIMITRDGLVKLADFGLAMQVEADTDDSTREAGKTGKVMGTPRYMSPEQARGLTLDHRSDQYSLGATLYHLLTGRPPFEHTTARDLMRAHVRSAVPDPREERSDLPPAWRHLCVRLLAKRPEERFADAKDLISAVASAVRGELRSSPQLRGTRGNGSAGRPSAMPLIGLAGLVIIGGLLGVWALSGGSRPGTGTEQRRGDEVGSDPDNPTVPSRLSAAEDFITALPDDLDAALRALRGPDGIGKAYFSSDPEALNRLRLHEQQLQATLKQRQAASLAAAQARLSAAEAPAKTGQWGEALLAIEALHADDRRLLAEAVTAARDRVQRAAQQQLDQTLRAIANSQDLETVQALSTTAALARLPADMQQRARAAGEARSQALRQAQSLREQEAREREQADTLALIANLDSYRAKHNETAADYSGFQRRIRLHPEPADEALTQRLRHLHRAAELAQAAESSLRDLLNAQPPVVRFDRAGSRHDFLVIDLNHRGWTITDARSRQMTVGRGFEAAEIDVPAILDLAIARSALASELRPVAAACFLWFWRHPAGDSRLSRLAGEHVIAAAVMPETALQPSAQANGQAPVRAARGFDATLMKPELLARFEGTGAAVVGNRLQWTPEGRLPPSPTESAIPSLTWLEDLSGPVTVTVRLDIRSQARFAVGLANGSERIRAGIDRSNQLQSQVLGLVTQGNHPRVNPPPALWPLPSGPFDVRLAIDAEGQCSITVAGKAVITNARFTGSGPVRLVFQNFNGAISDRQPALDIIAVQVE